MGSFYQRPNGFRGLSLNDRTILFLVISLVGWDCHSIRTLALALCICITYSQGRKSSKKPFFWHSVCQPQNMKKTRRRTRFPYILQIAEYEENVFSVVTDFLWSGTARFISSKCRTPLPFTISILNFRAGLPKVSRNRCLMTGTSSGGGRGGDGPTEIGRLLKAD